MEFKGTPGKWYILGMEKWFRIESKHIDERSICIYPTIATINTTFIKEDEARANAQLISKSKEMLQMLQQIAEDLENGDTPPVHIIHELIKEATTI